MAPLVAESMLRGLGAYFRAVAPWCLVLWATGVVVLLIGWHHSEALSGVGAAVILVDVDPRAAINCAGATLIVSARG